MKKLLVVIAALLLTACSGVADKENLTYQKKDQEALDLLVNRVKTNKPHRSHIKIFPIADKKLSQMYSEWAGTGYRLGGSTKDGIDCSAFMQEIFSNAFGIDLPRSTSAQRSVGKSVQKHQLKSGDLVFFRNNRHVGVYLGNNRFMHASTSEGVTISSLTEEYWNKHYTQSRRVF